MHGSFSVRLLYPSFPSMHEFHHPLSLIFLSSSSLSLTLLVSECVWCVGYWFYVFFSYLFSARNINVLSPPGEWFPHYKKALAGNTSGFSTRGTVASTKSSTKGRSTTQTTVDIPTENGSTVISSSNGDSSFEPPDIESERLQAESKLPASGHAANA